MALSDLPGELVERGVWWHIAGFAIVSTAVLVEFQGSETRAYQYLETACKTMYWANVFALIGLFEGMRRMFEKASELRARYREQAERKAEERGMKRGEERQRARRREAMSRFGVEVDGIRMLPDTPEVQRFMDGEEG